MLEFSKNFIGGTMAIFPKKKYQIIYADPPWRFETYSQQGKGRSPEKYYGCEGLNFIKSLPVQKISDENCILFLWTTDPMLNASFEVIEKWGFVYKTMGFVWVKRNKKSPTFFTGLGYWTRSNPEYCLLATKGSPRRISKSVHSVIDTPLQQHSKKPDVVRDRIVELCGDLPRIELFARQKAEGWNAWGNQV